MAAQRIAEHLDHALDRQSRHLPDRARAEAPEPRERLRPRAPQALHRHVAHERRDPVGRHHQQAVGLAEIGRELRQELARRDADRRDEAFLAAHRVLDAPRDCAAVAEQRPAAGHIEERLVDAQRFDEVGIAGQDGHEAR